MAIDIVEPLPRREAWKLLPEPTIHPVKDGRFEKHVPLQADGYKTAKARPRTDNDAVIVIDNGTFSAPMEGCCSVCRVWRDSDAFLL